MNSIFLFTISCILLIGFASTDFCSDNFTAGELPGGAVKHVSLTILHMIKIYFTGCSAAPVFEKDVKYLLVTRNNPKDPIQINTKLPGRDIDFKKKIIVLTPGWLCNITNDRMPELIEAYLGRYDCNIIVIDWTAVSIDLYPTAFCRTKGAAREAGTFFCNLSLYVDLRNIHLVGQSMGAHVSGIIGKEVQKQCNKTFGRITGLDPAGPMYYRAPKSMRLHGSDATFVDVIHTNMGMLGYYGTSGTVDFYPNCGRIQPDCTTENGTMWDRIFRLSKHLKCQKTVYDLGFVSDVCSHLRSADYMVKSLNSSIYIATSCKKCPRVCPDWSKSSSTVIEMGEDCPARPSRRKYMLYASTKQ